MNILITKPYFGQEELDYVKKTLDSGWVAQGPMVAEFEKKTAMHEHVKYAVATSSCTTALHMALLAHGVGRGNDVLVPSFTFAATANSVVYTGAVPVLIDIELDTYNISVEGIKEKIAQKYLWKEEQHKLINKDSGNELKVILVVHQFGLCAQMAEINSIAERFCLTVIEDAACALGARIGQTVQGGFGNTSCVSFHPRKCITTGEGGMVFTNDSKLFEKLCQLRSHGAAVSEIKRHHELSGFLLPSYSSLGYNYRMSDIQAAVGLAQINKLDDILEERRRLASQYSELLKDVKWLSIPTEPQEYFHTYQSYVCFFNQKELSIEEANANRNQILSILANKGIQTRQGTHAIHMLEYYINSYGYEARDLYNSYRADRLTIAIPLYVGMTEAEQRYVVDQLKDSYLQIDK